MALRHWLRGPATLALTAMVASSPVLAERAGFTPQAPAVGGCLGLGRQRADQHFIEMMIPHHDGAIAMAELALIRAKRPEIRELARQIIAGQTAENARMRGWYRQWFGMEVPAWNVAARGQGMGHGMGKGMPGMGTSLEGLRTAADLDRVFIEQMIPHHRMGVMMAAHARMHSQQPELRNLQAAMVRVQSEEIERMDGWYRRWYGPAGL